VALSTKQTDEQGYSSVVICHFRDPCVFCG
jgi:hypothetical protein